MAQPNLPPDDTPWPDAPSDDAWDGITTSSATSAGSTSSAASASAAEPAEEQAAADGAEGDQAGKVVDLDKRRKTRKPVASAEEQARIDAEFGSAYFAKVDGRTQFLVETLASAVEAEGPLACGIDGRMWSYGGGVWSPDKDVVRHRAARLLRQRYLAAHASNAEHVIRARLAEVGREIACEPVQEIINFRNGHLDWATGELREHDPELLSTVQLAIEWNPDSECPEFDKYLAEVLPEDMIETAWELIGYLMYNGNPLHKAIMLHGSGRNGKGVFLRVVKELLGKQNISGASLQALAEERFAPATLFGKSANVCGEIDGAYMEKTARFKEITGEDLMDAEFKGRDRFQFTSWAVPLFSANKIPGSADVTTGYMSRWVVLPFPRSFAGREDRGLTARVTTETELQGIAAKGVRALRNLLARGNFAETDSSRAAMEEFKRKVDQVRSWLDERADVSPSYPPVPRTALYDDYVRWAIYVRAGQLKAAEFYDRLTAIGEEDPAAGLKPHRSASGRHYLGVKLNPEPIPAPPPPRWGRDY